MTGTIALVGSGEYLEASRAIDEHLLGLLADRTPDGGARPPKVVCLPTASSLEGERVWNRWARHGVAWFSALGADAVSVPVIDRVSADDPAHAELVAGADLVYLSGGKPNHLHDTLVDTLTWAAVETMLAAGGVLAGCSAGAMIQGERIAGFRSVTHSDGFGLLPGAIVLPHFDEYPSMVGTAVKGLLGRGLSVVGIDGGTALVRHAGELRVVGRGSVNVWGPLGHAVFHDQILPQGAIGNT